MNSDITNLYKRLRKKLFGVNERQVFGYHRYPLNYIRSEPDFLIIGSQKAATTTLHSYLSKNTNIQSSKIKETQFFNMNYDRGIKYYKSCFPIKRNDKLTFETTPDYIDHPLAPKLCHQLLPNVKLIVTLREPVERAFSHFNFVQGYSNEEKEISFEEGLKLEQTRINKAFDLIYSDRYNSARMFSNYGYLRKGEYANHIINWLEYYPIENFHFVDFKDIINDINAVTHKICNFLKIPFQEVSQQKKMNVTKYNSEIKKETYFKLKSHYQEYNKRLFQLIQTELDW